MIKLEITNYADPQLMLLAAEFLTKAAGRLEELNQNTPPEPVKKPAKADEATLEQVRAAMKVACDDGKRTQVQALIASYGVKALTEIDKSNFGELLAKVGAL